MYRKLSFVATIALSSTLAACGGGGGANSLLPGGSGSNAGNTVQTESVIQTANDFGSPMKTLSDFNSSTSSGTGVTPQSVNTTGTCNNGVEFFVPDKKGDANSTERQFFYDAACTELARDVTRIFSSTSANAETVNATASTYALGNATEIAVRTDVNTFANATFDANGYAIAADGFDRQSSQTLNLAGSKTIVSSDELVMQAASGGTSNFCGDSAGYNATGIASLNETFGWQGGVLSGGTRTVNGDGSVTWTSTHTGNSVKGAIGSLSVATGTANSTCPIGTPMFTLNGGTQGGSYTIPVTATYSSGTLISLSISNAQLANGNTLNVSTNAGQPPTSSTFISGTIANNGAQIATFAVDAFGDGTLTVTSSGKQFVMNDWHVVK